MMISCIRSSCESHAAGRWKGQVGRSVGSHHLLLDQVLQSQHKH